MKFHEPERLQPFLCFIGFHDWTKWKSYKWKGMIKPLFSKRMYPCSKNRQKRYCVECGTTQDEGI